MAGVARLTISDKRDDLSSLSREWIPLPLRSRELPVAMLTLDDLVREYGSPGFIKIDVEGYEEAVLDGLTTLPPMLSFEFNSKYLDAGMRCLRKTVFRGSRFNFAFEDPVRFELSGWVTAEELMTRLQQVSGYGDIFVKTGQTSP
jgi:hypothetical protein